MAFPLRAAAKSPLGFPNLFRYHGIPSPQFSYDGMFSVLLYRPIDFEKWVNILTVNRVAILRAINNNNKITKKDLEGIVGIGSTALDNNLTFLKESGLLDRIGTKGGTWQIHFINPKRGE